MAMSVSVLLAWVQISMPSMRTRKTVSSTVIATTSSLVAASYPQSLPGNRDRAVDRHALHGSVRGRQGFRGGPRSAQSRALVR